ncbi:GNAT family N-acetyltransferase [Aliidongia dinghuensis]|uniref:GNAT family N-acetyltransferase n=1 Tax=Aliidongia dinghuensis TaxID=1867774 RepID=UPI001E41DD29|nr:GNAT family N-acetyltransferase [Aliidongia dinghuensis]
MSDLTYRRATATDLPALVAMLADDMLGQARERPEDPLPDAYRAGFAAIDEDPRQLLLVVERAGAIAGMLQLTFIPGISHMGAWRCQIEGVRVASTARGAGIGEAMLRHAIGVAREHGCRIVQLTTNKARADAKRFYERLGFEPAHEGMKLTLG